MSPVFKKLFFIFIVLFPASISSFKSNPNSTLTISLAGDMMPGGRLIEYMDRYGVEYPFKKIKNILEDSNVIFCNLETPITDSDSPLELEKEFVFKLPTRFSPILKTLGFNLISLANNHIMDYGHSGLMETLSILDYYGIGHSGAGEDLDSAIKPAVINVNGYRIGLLAFSMTLPSSFYASDSMPGTAYPYEPIFKNSVGSSSSSFDFTIVSFHWGGEALDTTRSYQRIYAHKAIDYGADLVVGHHPHVLQGFEFYKKGLIAYSLGNLVFGSWSKIAKESIILKVWWDGAAIVKVRIIPLVVDNFAVKFQPEVMKPEAALNLFNRLTELSQELNQGKLSINRKGFLKHSN